MNRTRPSIQHWRWLAVDLVGCRLELRFLNCARPLTLRARRPRPETLVAAPNPACRRRAKPRDFKVMAGSPTACRSTAVERQAANVRQERGRSTLIIEETSHLGAHLRGAQIPHALGKHFLKRHHEGDEFRTRPCSFELQNEEKRPQAHGIDNQAVHQFLRCRKTFAGCQRTRRWRLRWSGFQARCLNLSGAEQRMVYLGGKDCELRHPGSCAIGKAGLRVPAIGKELHRIEVAR